LFEIDKKDARGPGVVLFALTQKSGSIPGGRASKTEGVSPIKAGPFFCFG